MYLRKSILAAALVLLASLGPLAAAHTTARLVLDANPARAGDTITAGIHLRMDPDWHTYWKNAGASGMPTAVEWQLPPGWTAGDLQWPTPEKYGSDDLVTYVYHDEVVLLVPLTLAKDAPEGAAKITAKVSWLECKESCVPGDATVTATLTVAGATQPSAEAKLIETWRGKLPQPGTALNLRADWEGPAQGDLRPLWLEWIAHAGDGKADFFPEAGDTFEVEGASEHLSVSPDRVRLRKMVRIFDGHWPDEVKGLIVSSSGEERRTYEVRATIGAGGQGRGDDADTPLRLMLLYAFLGGLILNVMPCVLPVIALKILGFVAQAREAPGRVRWLGIVHTLGVLASFLVLAGLVIGLQAAGNKVGWGLQFSNPYFLVAITILVTLVALNLFGVFEITLGGRAMSGAAELSSQPGATGAFFNGLLATVLATSCTAPLLGAALGFAFAQPPAVIVLMLLTVGLGLAAPSLALSLHPAWLRLLPKPGVWMERFKVAMGFPMLAAAVWLLSVVEAHYGERTWWLGLGLVAVALAAWIYGGLIQRGARRRGLAWLVILGLLGGTYYFVLEGQLRWREPLSAEAAAGVRSSTSEGIAWERWTPEAVAQARAAGRPVFVDFTAKWCLTCQANKKLAIEVPSVRAKLKAINAVTLLGDYTRFPPEITDELNRFHRAGVPLVLVYPRQADQPPMVLPEALTPGIVLDALEKAGS
ncbi:MAG TPA: protein-disulfide reductase DsbD family protein [Verrucomicrobiota bacterium]|nr:thioredoxin family protein [Verrucomicrobiota bacterium]HPY29227.1 protein-disulfide reductase DsbD family protein [Verrucomicrobiota bacterium]HQB15200.1 protein-disulfide reductase DsbD family protein [Verrucomicrobiota bacterium]